MLQRRILMLRDYEMVRSEMTVKSVFRTSTIGIIVERVHTVSWMTYLWVFNGIDARENSVPFEVEFYQAECSCWASWASQYRVICLLLLFCIDLCRVFLSRFEWLGIESYKFACWLLYKHVTWSCQLFHTWFLASLSLFPWVLLRNWFTFIERRRPIELKYTNCQW